jgi:hypothetical protein
LLIVGLRIIDSQLNRTNACVRQISGNKILIKLRLFSCHWDACYVELAKCRQSFSKLLVTGLAIGAFISAALAQSTGATTPDSLAKRSIDIDGSGKSVLVVRTSTSANPQMQVGRLVSTPTGSQFQFSHLADPGANFRVVGATDYDGNDRTDLVLQNMSQGEFGDVHLWSDFSSATSRILRQVKQVWDVQVVGDLDGDGKGDLVWRYVVRDSPDTGVSYIWFSNGNNAPIVRKRGGAPLDWRLLGAADLNQDAAADMVYISPAGQLRVLMATPARTCANLVAGNIPTGFSALAFADFTARKRGDVLIRNATTGQVSLLALNAIGLTLPSFTGDPDDRNASCTSSNLVVSNQVLNLPVSDPSWQFYAAGDYDGNGSVDIVWLKPDGMLAVWLMGAEGNVQTVIPNAGATAVGFAASQGTTYWSPAGGTNPVNPPTVIINTPPTVSVVTPSNNASSAINTLVNIAVMAADSDGTVAKVEFFASLNGVNTKLGEDTSAPYTFTWTPTVAGSYLLTARATDDKAATTTSAAITVSVSAAPPPTNQSPTVGLLSPASGTSVTTGTTVAISATAADSDGTIAKVEFFASLNGVNTKLGEDTSAPYTFTWTPTVAGSYLLTARATDDKAATTTSAAITVNVNAAPPPVNQSPTVGLLSPASGTSVTTGTTVAISATAADSDGSIAKVEFFASLNGVNTKLGEDASAPYTFTWTPTIAGSYSITALATDNRGATTLSVAVMVTVTQGAQPPTGASYLPWSEAATWGGTLPRAGDAVTIPAGRRILLDISPPNLKSLLIEGELNFDLTKDLNLTADWILVSGAAAKLNVGRESAPYLRRATVTLTGNNATESIMGMGTKLLGVMSGGTIEMFGAPPAVAWTKLNQHAQAGATSVTLERSVDWKAGDQIVVAPTQWYGWTDAPQAVQDAATQTERRTLSIANGTQLTLAAALGKFRWGLMQYVTDAGLSLIPGTFTKPHPDAVDRLDERAEVGNLTRNIVVQGEDSTAWRNNGFGAHVMIMDRASMFKLDGVELRRMGQAGIVGRYPIHWHLLSYDLSGNNLGDATGHFVRNSTVWDSRQRCIVIHGTNGVTVQNNICYDIKGHGIFIEDAVERRNIIDRNLVLRVRSPIDSLAVSEHEKRHFCGASAGYWLTNPDNTVTNNAVADAQGNGFWLSYPQRPVKQGKLVPLRPVNMAHAAFDFNSARSNGNNGLMLECAMTDDAGNLELLKYSPTTDGSNYNYQNGMRFTLRGITATRNGAGYVNRAVNPDYLQWAVAGNLGRAFSGAVDAGSTLKQSLVVGMSLNTQETYPSDAEPQLGVASYHSAMDIVENTFINLPNRGYVLTSNGGDISSGAFGTNDYYLRPLEKGFWRNPGNKLINADPGYRALPPHMQANYTPSTNNNWTLSGAVWDPHGYWSAAGRWVVLNSPFLREASCVTLMAKNPTNLANGLSCAGPFYGVSDIQLDRGLPTETNRYSFLETLEVIRQDTAGSEIGRWRVEQGYTSNFLGNMRHFTAVKDGIYIMRFPAFPNASATKKSPRWLNVGLDGVMNAGDNFLLGVQFDGAITPSRVFFTTNETLTLAANRNAVAAGNGSLYWQDRANNLIWVKVTPRAASFWAGTVPGSDDDLYRSFALQVHP